MQIRLTDDEGGLNLDMSKEIINAVVKKGEDAGDLLTGFNMRAHQWVRFRVLMRQIEKSLYDLRDAISPGSFYDSTLRTRPLDPSFPYQRPDDWLDQAEIRLDEIGRAIDAIRKMTPEVLFAAESPQPEPVLRVTPQI
ncbi:MAG TPA: hypothetical protein VE642_12970 [Pyrinomonadaceae bacterium]|nr:hypothetical protein [Pyrinomonadaceae bacterium]